MSKSHTAPGRRLGWHVKGRNRFGCAGPSRAKSFPYNPLLGFACAAGARRKGASRLLLGGFALLCVGMTCSMGLRTAGRGAGLCAEQRGL